MWELESGRELRTLKGHADWVSAVAAVTPDGRRAISASLIMGRVYAETCCWRADIDNETDSVS